MKNALPFLAFLICGSAVFAFQDAPRLPANADIQDLLTWLDEYNPALRAAKHDIAAADAVVETKGYLPDPTAGLTLFAVEVETRVGPQRQKLDLSQTVPWPGKLKLEKEGASLSARAAREDIEILRFRIHRQFKYLYAQYYFLGKSLEINKDHLILLESLDSVVDTKYRTGETSYSNLVRIDVEIDRFRDRITTLQDMAAPVLAQLNALLGRAQNHPISFPGMLHDTQIDLTVAPEDTIFKGLPNTNPQLRTLEHLDSAAQNQIEQSRLAGKPDFRFNMSYINTGSAIMNGVVGSGDDPLMFGVGVNIPWNRKKYKAMETVAYHRRQNIVQERADTLNQLTAELKNAFFAYRDAHRKIGLYRDSILPKAMESWMVTLKSFESDSSDFLDVIDAEQTLLEFKLSLHRAMADRTRAMADIEMLTGVPLPMPRSHQGGHGH